MTPVFQEFVYMLRVCTSHRHSEVSNITGNQELDKTVTIRRIRWSGSFIEECFVRLFCVQGRKRKLTANATCAPHGE